MGPITFTEHLKYIIARRGPGALGPSTGGGGGGGGGVSTGRGGGGGSGGLGGC